MKRTKKDIFRDDDPYTFFLKAHPINGINGFKLWYTRVLGMDFKPFHKQWIEPLINKSYDRIAIAAPTGFGKTELFAIGYTTWNMWYNITSNKEPWEGLITSTSMPQSIKILDRVKDTIINNEVLAQLKGPSDFVWSQTQIKLKNFTSLSCKPLNENIKSYHVNYVFADEVASYTDWDCYFKYVSTRINSKKGQLVAVSTFEGPNDLLVELQSKTNYYSIITQALKNGKSIWEEKYPTKYLLERKKEIGERAFALQYMSDITTPIDDENSPFPLSLLAKNADPKLSFETEPEENCYYYASYDPAFSVEGDYNAIVVGKVKNNQIIITNMIRYKGDPDRAISILKGIDNKFHLQRIIIDSNAGGSKTYRDFLMAGLPAYSFPTNQRLRLNAFRSTIQAFHSGKIVLPTCEKDSNTKKMIKIFFNEITHFSTETTPTKLITYRSHTKNDDIAVAFIMLIWFMVNKNILNTQTHYNFSKKDKETNRSPVRYFHINTNI